jgi:hypothetical protein
MIHTKDQRPRKKHFRLEYRYNAWEVGAKEKIVDEFWSFVGKKSNQRWTWDAIGMPFRNHLGVAQRKTARLGFFSALEILLIRYKSITPMHGQCIQNIFRHINTGIGKDRT